MAHERPERLERKKEHNERGATPEHAQPDQNESETILFTFFGAVKPHRRCSCSDAIYKYTI